MERLHVEISLKNLKFLKEKKEKKYWPFKMTVNAALDTLRKKETENGKTF